MKLAHFAARDAHVRNSRQPRQARPDRVSRKVSQSREIALVRSQAVSGNGKYGERESFDIANRRCRRQGRRQLRQPRLDQLQRLKNIDAPVEEQAYLRSAARSSRLDA